MNLTPAQDVDMIDAIINQLLETRVKVAKGRLKQESSGV